MDNLKTIRSILNLMEKELNRKVPFTKMSEDRTSFIHCVANQARKNHVHAYAIIIRDLLKEIEEKC